MKTVTLLGNSASGKSTLLNLLIGKALLISEGSSIICQDEFFPTGNNQISNTKEVKEFKIFQQESKQLYKFADFPKQQNCFTLNQLKNQMQVVVEYFQQNASILLLTVEFNSFQNNDLSSSMIDLFKQLLPIFKNLDQLCKSSVLVITKYQKQYGDPVKMLKQFNQKVVRYNIEYNISDEDSSLGIFIFINNLIEKNRIFTFSQPTEELKCGLQWQRHQEERDLIFKGLSQVEPVQLLRDRSNRIIDYNEKYENGDEEKYQNIADDEDDLEFIFE